MTEPASGSRDLGEHSDGDPDARRSGTPESARAPTLVRALAWTVAFVITAVLGELTAVGDHISLVQPATGVGLLWVTTCRDRTLPAVLALVAALGGAVSIGAGAGLADILDSVVAMPLGLLTFRVLVRRWTSDLWSWPVSRRVQSVREYAVLSWAAVLAGVVNVLVALALSVPAGGTSLHDAAAIATTHVVGMLVFGVPGLLTRSWDPAEPPGGVLRSFRDTLQHEVGGRDLLWALGLLAGAAVVLAAGFWWVPTSPVIFVLVMLVVAVGVRFGTLATGCYALALITAATVLTDASRGPIADLDDPRRQAVAFGMFAISVMSTGLTIALSRRERDATIGRMRESEAAAAGLADDLGLVLASLDEGVAVIDQDDRLLHANAALDRLFGLDHHRSATLPPLSGLPMTHLDGKPLEYPDLPHVRVLAGEPMVREVVQVRRAGIQTLLELTARPLPEADAGRASRVLMTVRDVTAEHQQRDALASYAHVVAHDLRTPLASASGWARELLERYEDGQVDRESGALMAGHVVAAAERMQQFISDMLAYAMSRNQRPDPVRVELADLLEGIVEAIAAAEGERPAVTWTDLPAVWCDPVLLPQVFDNLVGNARKYVAPGVVPRTHVEATPLARGWVCLRVHDNGVGIPVADRHRIFDTFERAHPGFEGTGLGLAICRQIVEKHGGSIAVVDPREGFNTCIELTLPMSEDAYGRTAEDAS